MNLGAEPKKVMILGGLALVGGYVFYTNVLSTDTPAANPPKSAAPAAAQIAAPAPSAGQANAFRKKSIRVSGEFRPTLKFAPGERPNFATLDPTLRLDLLAKVQGIAPEGGARSLFAFSTAPPPPPTAQTAAVVIHPKRKVFGPEPPPAPPGPPAARVEPPPPPISLKFYGYSAPRADGQKRAFFLDGDDIFVASEGEMVKKRYRVVQIGINSVVMEDTQFKNNRQTLILQQEQAG